ncbi:hypothetical protein [Cloacibacillus evryensis]|nr:hypothetical protein [Cloacibacillus evryensis]MCQ4765490.1 hypothetical protein [Cloacibacillus evryensis]
MQIDIKRWSAELTDKLLGVYDGGLLCAMTGKAPLTSGLLRRG